MDPALFCKIFFSLGTAVDIGGTLIPSFRRQIMNYGSRSTTSKPSEPTDPKNTMRSLFEYVASFQVPHTWFAHYYVVSMASSIFWGVQIVSHGRALRFLALCPTQTAPAMTLNQVFLAWLLMLIQGGRRLCESLTFMKASKSQMWFGLWLVGMVYYLFIGVSVWIEGIPALSQTPSLANLNFSRPSGKTSFAIPLFLLASFSQHICHKHLASLKKYSLPEHRLFQSIVCPHYTSECLIYSAIAVVSAPKGQLLNRTVFAGLGFVASNLAVTADSTRKWYVEKFGDEQLAGRWRMVPFLF